MLIVEYWRSRLFPRELAYVKAQRVGLGGHGNGHKLPDIYEPERLARILRGIDLKYGPAERELVVGHWGMVTRLVFKARDARFRATSWEFPRYR